MTTEKQIFCITSLNVLQESESPYQIIAAEVWRFTNSSEGQLKTKHQPDRIKVIN
jgi:hypothetical protein